jgi:hypothetical protein
MTQYKCHYCGVIFNDRKVIRKHLMAEHKASMRIGCYVEMADKRGQRKPYRIEKYLGLKEHYDVI